MAFAVVVVALVALVLLRFTIQVQPRAVGRADFELIPSGGGGEQRTAPGDAELVRINAVDRGALGEVKGQCRVLSIQHELFLFVHSLGLKILRAQSGGVARRQGVLERAEQIGDRLAELPVGQAGESPFRQWPGGLRGGGVKRSHDVFRHLAGFLAVDQMRLVVGHVAIDVAGQ